MINQVVDAAIIKKDMLLLVKKNDTWILPGGKPLTGETDEQCVQREVAEELSGTKIYVDEFFEIFNGISPNRKARISVNVYLCSLEGALGDVSGEIKEKAWVKYNDVKNYNLAEVTRDIVKSLRQNGRYTGF